MSSSSSMVFIPFACIRLWMKVTDMRLISGPSLSMNFVGK